MMRRPLIDRLMERVRKTETCWEWIGYVHPKTGYGMFTVKGSGTSTAHRWVYQELVGAIPAGQELDHLCRNRRCVRPDHLEPVSRHENIMRGLGPDATRQRAADRATCRNGHPWTPENTGTSGPGTRRCRACGRLVAQRVRDRKKAAA